MVKTIRVVLCLGCFVTLVLAQGAAKWTITQGIATPESAYVDPVSGFLFVSSVEGQPNEKDGKGHITKATTDGKVVAASWVAGLNAPGPLAAFGLARQLGYADEISNTVVDAIGDISGGVRLHESGENA